MIRRLLRALFVCAHSDSYRERRAGVLHMVCADCNHATPVVMGERKKIVKLERQWAKSRAWKADKPPAEIIVMPRIHRKEGA